MLLEFKKKRTKNYKNLFLSLLCQQCKQWDVLKIIAITYHYIEEYRIGLDKQAQ